MPTTHVIMCQRQFVPPIKSGAKPHTIRGARVRVIKAGDLLDLRAWLGKPYRSKQEKIRVVTVTRVRPITIKPGDFRIGRKRLNYSEAQALARADGFLDEAEFTAFFRDTHGLPFTGNLIEWNPTP